MSFTFKSIRGSLKMGKTPTVTQIDNVTSSGVNFEYINTSEIVLKNVGAGVVHTDSKGLFSTSPLVTTDIADKAVTKEKIADSIKLNGIPTAPTADTSTNSEQIATTAYVKTIISELMGSASETLDTLQELAAALQNKPDFGNEIVELIGEKVSRAGVDLITGIKTFASNATPIFKSLTTTGVVHNDSDGNLTTSLVTFSDIETGLRSKVQYLIDMYDNKQPTSEPAPAAFVHVTSLIDSEYGQVFFKTTRSEYVYKLTNGVRYIIETPMTVYLPVITKEGMTYSITNKSGQTIIVSTDKPEVKMYSCFVAPEGDDAFEVDNHRTLDVYSMIVNGGVNDSDMSWQARFE